MITIIEGIRNVGKTYLLSRTYTKVYKFDFPYWFKTLDLEEKESTHLFALGKEILLHNLNKEQFINGLIVDRGILSVLVWGVMKGRINRKTAVKQLKDFANKGLLDNVRIVYIDGDNPNKRDCKDAWDCSNPTIERTIYGYLLSQLSELDTTCEIIRLKNNYDEDTVKEFNKIIEKSI